MAAASPVFHLVRAGGAGLPGTHDLGRAPGAVAPLDRSDLSFPHRDGVRRHRCVWPHVRFRRVLRSRQAHTAHVQRHGGRRRLDERGLVHQPVGGAVLAGVLGHFGAGRWAGLPAGLDGRVLSGGDADCTAPAGHGAVHRARFFPCALWRALAAHHCSAGGGDVLVHLRGGADLWRGVDRFAPDGGAVRDRHHAGPGGRAAVLVLGRHACHHLDAGGAVRGAAAGVFDSRVLAGLQAAGQPHGPGRLWRADQQDCRAGNPAS